MRSEIQTKTAQWHWQLPIDLPILFPRSICRRKTEFGSAFDCCLVAPQFFSAFVSLSVLVSLSILKIMNLSVLGATNSKLRHLHKVISLLDATPHLRSYGDWFLFHASWNIGILMALFLRYCAGQWKKIEAWKYFCSNLALVCFAQQCSRFITWYLNIAASSFPSFFSDHHPR